MARGYMGKMLWVDLSKKEMRDEVLDGLCHSLGGYGFMQGFIQGKAELILKWIIS
jgi:hypothetical protein